MEFRNLTPFHAMAYGALNVHDEEHHVVALRVAYALRAAPERTQGLGEAVLTHRCEVLVGDEAGELCVADQYDGEQNASTVRAESDLAPYKPRCDVLLRATARSPGGAASPQWAVRMRVSVPDGDGAAVKIDKTLSVSGPRWFERTNAGWTLTEALAAQAVPMRWELAFGGASRVVGDDAVLLDEVCFTNPLGVGWMSARTPDALERVRRPAPTRIEAPQIEDPQRPLREPVVARHPDGPLDARRIAEVAADYGAEPVGFGYVGRAWTPRIQRAGTYDDAWLSTRHPFLPADFSFRYWNAAPDDQQIPHPPPGLQVELWNLTAPHEGAYVAFTLPPHRGFVMAMVKGLPLPVPGVLDTVLVDAEAMKVVCVWRTLVPRAVGVDVLQARFEVDPTAPLLKMEGEGERVEATT